jgi:hypothetical protein
MRSRKIAAAIAEDQLRSLVDWAAQRSFPASALDDATSRDTIVVTGPDGWYYRVETQTSPTMLGAWRCRVRVAAVNWRLGESVDREAVTLPPPKPGGRLGDTCFNPDWPVNRERAPIDPGRC